MTDPKNSFHANPFANTITNPFVEGFDAQQRELERELQASPFLDPALRSAPGTPERAASPVIPPFALRTPGGKNTVDLRRVLETDRRQPVRLPVVAQADQASDTSSRRSSIAALRHELDNMRAQLAQFKLADAAVLQPVVQRASELVEYADRYSSCEGSRRSSRASEAFSQPRYSAGQVVARSFSPPNLHNENSTAAQLFVPIEGLFDQFYSNGLQLAAEWRQSDHGSEDRPPSYTESQRAYGVDEDVYSDDDQVEFEPTVARNSPDPQRRTVFDAALDRLHPDLLHPDGGAVSALWINALDEFKGAVDKFMPSFRRRLNGSDDRDVAHCEKRIQELATSGVEMVIRHKLQDDFPDAWDDEIRPQSEAAANAALAAFKRAVEQVEHQYSVPGSARSSAHSSEVEYV